MICFGLALPLAAQVPQMNTVQPEGGKVGAVLRIHGTNLSKARVDEVYLTDHTHDMKVRVLDQSDNAIEFRIPPSVKPGKLLLLVKISGKQAVLLEQPVYITVEEEKETGEVAAASK